MTKADWEGAIDVGTFGAGCVQYGKGDWAGVAFFAVIWMAFQWYMVTRDRADPEADTEGE